MAKSKDKKAVSETKEEPKEDLSIKIIKDSETGNRKIDWLTIVKTVLPAIGIFTALLYFLGRVRTEAYYYYLGINPSVLQFGTEDYMFLSFNMVMMLLALIGIVLARQYFKSKLEEPKTVLVVIVTFFIFVLLFYTNTLNYTNTIRNLTEVFPLSVVALFQGVILGIAFVFLFVLYNNLFGIMNKVIEGIASYSYKLQTKIRLLRVINLVIYKINYYGKKVTILMLPIRGYLLALVIIFLLSVSLGTIPKLAENWGEQEAKYDLENNLPDTIIYSNKDLPIELREKPEVTTKSKEVKLVTTNNGMTYVIDRDDKIADRWRVFTIPEENISQIVYLHYE